MARRAAGAPVLKLRGDYLAIVTLGFGEIIRVFINNLEHPVNITNGPSSTGPIDDAHLRLPRCPSAADCSARLPIRPVTLYYFLPGAGGHERASPPPRGSRIGRAWMAIREDEIAAKAMGINTAT